MRIRRGIALAAACLTAASLCSCAGQKIEIENAVPSSKIEGSTLCVRKVENLPEDFIMGMDASSVIAEENSGVKYFGFDGQEQDVFKTLAEAGVNTIRVRVWNDPFDPEGRGYGGGNCDINNAVMIGRRATQYGMSLLVDFHLSDFWADPGKQFAPKAWAELDAESKAKETKRFVKESLKALKKAGVSVRMVQIGNETNGKLCGESSWESICRIIQAGCEACREVFPKALTAVHFANPEKASSYANYAASLNEYGVDYDVFASSYYPYWHGTLENLGEVLNNIGRSYNKKVMVMETSYAYTGEDSDFSGNTISAGESVKPYPFTVHGQANCVRDVIDTVVNGMENGIGVIYWEGTWITVGTESWEKNHELWEKYGSGWASSYAASYDPEDAGKYYGGCAVDNQAMFAPDGKPLESLRVFNLVRYGNDVSPTPDAVEDVELTVDLGSEIALPQTVAAVMTDNSRIALPVVWDVSAERLAQMSAGGPAVYTVNGAAEGGFAVKCTIRTVAFNYLENSGFESGRLEPWRVTERGSASELYVENKATDSLSGTWHFHFWSSKRNSVDFSLEQDVTALPAGKYSFTVSIMGGDCGAAEIYAYALVDGIEAGRAPLVITSYGNWDTALIDGIEIPEGSVLTVGVSVKCEGEGSGAWGKIDEAAVNSSH